MRNYFLSDISFHSWLNRYVKFHKNNHLIINPPSYLMWFAIKLRKCPGPFNNIFSHFFYFMVIDFHYSKILSTVKHPPTFTTFHLKLQLHHHESESSLPLSPSEKKWQNQAINFVIEELIYNKYWKQTEMTWIRMHQSSLTSRNNRRGGFCGQLGWENHTKLSNLCTMLTVRIKWASCTTCVFIHHCCFPNNLSDRKIRLEWLIPLFGVWLTLWNLQFTLLSCSLWILY